MTPSNFLRSIKRILTAALSEARRQRLRSYVDRQRPVPFRHRGRTYHLNPDDSAIAHVQESVPKIQRLVDLIGRPPRSVVDVGANCGLFAAFVHAAYPDAAVHCFEPSEELLPYIRMNCRPSVRVYGIALTESDGLGTLYVNRHAQQTNSLDAQAVALFAGDSDIERREVRCRSLDSFADENNLSDIDVLKIDVQGYEGAVLRGARRVLPSVDKLFIESTWIDAGSMTNVIPFAREYGFEHIAVINPVYTGADLLLSRSPINAAREFASLEFTLSDRRFTERWF